MPFFLGIIIMKDLSRRNFLKGSASLASLAAIGGGSPIFWSNMAYAADTIKVGVLFSLTGTTAIVEESLHKATILAIEEMGKALIIGLGVKNAASKRAYPTHIEKQSATFALLSAYEISKMSKSRLRRKLDKTGGNFNEMGPLSLQFSYARSGFFENLRMTVTYADEKPIYPLQEIDDGNFVDLAVELLKWFKIAQHAIKNAVAMDLASTFFENDLGRM